MQRPIPPSRNSHRPVACYLHSIFITTNFKLWPLVPQNNLSFAKLGSIRGMTTLILHELFHWWSHIFAGPGPKMSNIIILGLTAIFAIFSCMCVYDWQSYIACCSPSQVSCCGFLLPVPWAFPPTHQTPVCAKILNC